ncbi:MAG: MobF family relaxase [Acidobacteriota bacterium]
MMTMSKALGAGQAKRYHQEQLRNAAENYYSQGQEILGQWDGRLAAAWGLTGAVSAAHFARLADGQHPLTEAPLVRHLTRHTYTNAQGHPVSPVEHRAGWDLTFSAPKSVSLTALVGGDARIRDAHRQAVEMALRATEPYVQARMGGDRPAQTTGRWIAATFEHDSARPVGGYAAPQLHTHTVVFNVTTTDEGRTRALQPRELYRTQQYATAVYRSELASQLLALGYAIERGDHGQPEIRGLTPDYLGASSPRRQQIATHLEQQGRRGAAAAQIAAYKTREAKSQAVAPDEMRRLHRQLAAAFDDQPARAVATAHVRAAALARVDAITATGLVTSELADAHATAARQAADVRRQAVTYATQRNVERDAVPEERAYVRDALSRSMGRATVSEIHAEFDRQVRGGYFVEVAQPDGHAGRRFTTPMMIALERRTIAMMVEGQRTQPPLIRDETRARIARAYPHLSADQQAAITQLFANRDRVQVLDGVAGAGKTTTLAAVRDAAERDGYTVRGFAPTGRAAQKLAEAGMSTMTLQKHLQEAPDARDPRRLYVLDESSLASTQQLHDFLARRSSTDRVLLVGDTRQHQAVDAGRPYEQLQEAGVAVARLQDIQRQQDPDLKRVVEHLSVAEVRAGLARLEEQGRIHEIPDRRDRMQAVATAYAAHPDQTLVVSPDNHSREALNAQIRQTLQQAGRVATREHTTRVLVPRQDLTGADRRWAGRYAPGDVIRYARGSATHGLHAGDYARVTRADTDTNTLMVTRPDGATVTYDPRRLQGVMVYREADRQLAVGDRVQFTAPFPEHHVTNRELGTLTTIDRHQHVRVHLDSGRIVDFALRTNPHLDYGYAVTSHSSQGQTADRVLLYLDSERAGEALVNQRLAYVAVSRGRHDAQIYTDDREQLPYALSRDYSKSSALTVGQDIHVQPPDRSVNRTPHALERRGPLHQTEHAATSATSPSTALAVNCHTGDASHGHAAEPAHPADRGFSPHELARAREYLALPAAQAYLRGRETAQGRTHQWHPTTSAPPIEARHVAAVLRQLPPDTRGQYATEIHAIKQTPAVILRTAAHVAQAEHARGSAKAVTPSHETLAQAVTRPTVHGVGQERG